MLLYHDPALASFLDQYDMSPEVSDNPSLPLSLSCASFPLLFLAPPVPVPLWEYFETARNHCDLPPSLPPFRAEIFEYRLFLQKVKGQSHRWEREGKRERGEGALFLPPGPITPGFP